MDTKFILPEKEMPTRWYNIQADLPSPLPPVLHPGTKQPDRPAGPGASLPDGADPAGGQHGALHRHPGGSTGDPASCGVQRPSIRAHRLEKALGTPAKIYYKYEGA